jgi:2-polyprenyl-6-methoxyphenol hydroxylase-like FAD-dependent oxidoreductase
MACVSNALIVGGGIAGLSAALALARIGLPCDVLEIADAPLGASLGLTGRAIQALDELGVYDDCRATARVFMPGETLTSLHDAAGNLLSPAPTRPNLPGIKDGLGVYRPVFLDILADHARRHGVVIRQGVTAEAIEDGTDNVAVTVSNGERRRYDIVIGADGIGSRTRSLIFPDAPAPAYAGHISIRWMAPAPPVAGEAFYLCPMGRVGFYYLPAQGMVYVPAVVPMSEWRRFTDGEIHALLARLLDSYTAPAMVELRRRLTPDAKLIGRPFEWILVPEPWHRGRTILIGDAAHATTANMGQGGGMAIEDSVVLGQCIRDASTLTDAFGNFMRRRFARVKTVVESSVELSKLDAAKAPPTEYVRFLTAALGALGQPY